MQNEVIMKRLMTSALSALLVLSAAVALAGGNRGGPNGSFEVRHFDDPERSGPSFIIRVSARALQAHLDHGDCVFPDPELPEDIEPLCNGGPE